VLNRLLVTTHLLISCPHDISAVLPSRLVPAVLSASKSSNSDTRANAISLLEAICRRCQDDNVRARMVTEILALPKTGKTSSPEHRTSLFSMAATVPPSDPASNAVLDTLAPLIGKEGNEPALHALALAIIPHLSHLLQANIPVSSATSGMLCRELGSSKLSVRRSLSQAIGEAVWQVQGSQLFSEGAKLLGSMAEAFEANLHNASNNTAAIPGGYLEGLVAAALAWGPLTGVPSASKLTSSPALRGLLFVTPKPSYLLNERVQNKLPSLEDNRWLLRSLESAVVLHGEKVGPHNVRWVVRRDPS